MTEEGWLVSPGQAVVPGQGHWELLWDCVQATPGVFHEAGTPFPLLHTDLVGACLVAPFFGNQYLNIFALSLIW